MVKPPSKAALNAATKRFEDRFARNFGTNSLKQASGVNPYEVISTGSLTLDHRLSVGGYVEGRLVEIWGPDGVGKTTMALIGISEAQRKHPTKRAAFVDVEQKFDAAWAAAHGVDLDRLYLYTPQSAEDVADALKMLCSPEANVSMIVVDSIGAMIPEKEKEKDAGESAMGKYAGIVTRMVKIAAVEAAKTNTVVLLINQVRANLAKFGGETTTGGGFALKHATTMKFKMRRTGTPPYKVKLGAEERVVGHEIAIQIERNGVGPAYRTAMISLFHITTDHFGPLGIDMADEATTLAVETGIIQRSGGWYLMPGGEKVQGRDGVVERLRLDAPMLDGVKKAVLAAVASEITEETPPEEIPEEPVEGQPQFRKGTLAHGEV